MRVSAQLAYILHKRPFGETSQILEVFTRDHGRVCLMSKGSRGPKSRTSGVLQSFRPLLIGWQGRGEMPALREVDSADIRPPALSGKALLSAVYLNELLMHLLHRYDVHQNLFGLYHDALYALASEPAVESVLRGFEKNLLEEIGFALNLSVDADTGASLNPEARYSYQLEHGPVRCVSGAHSDNQLQFSGAALLAFHQDRLLPEHSHEVKQLMRYVLQHYLGHKRLRSRDLFRAPTEIR